MDDHPAPERRFENEDRALTGFRRPPDDLPVGTITFLFTDVDDGGALPEQGPDRMPEVVARIDDLLRRADHPQGGYLFKWRGQPRPTRLRGDG